MFKRQYQLAMSLCLVATTTISAHADVVPDSSNLDHVLSQLSRQHNNASDLVKSVRQPSSLALNSQLMSNYTVNPTDNSNILDKLSAVASTTVSRFSQTGVASWYGRQFQGKKTASGETFDNNAFTAAHRSLPLNCYIKVTNKSNGKTVIVKVNDRPTLQGNRVLDLSYAAAKQIGITNSATSNVLIERIDNPY